MMQPPTEQWRSRIVGYGYEAPDQLLASPSNWRIHPAYQRSLVESSLDVIGWVADVLVNQRTGHVVDGHLRVSAALARGEEQVPVRYVDLSPEEELVVLASLDPLSAMAIGDTGKLDELLTDLRSSDLPAGMVDDLEAYALPYVRMTGEGYVQEPSKQKKPTNRIPDWSAALGRTPIEFELRVQCPVSKLVDLLGALHTALAPNDYAALRIDDSGGIADDWYMMAVGAVGFGIAGTDTTPYYEGVPSLLEPPALSEDSVGDTGDAQNQQTSKPANQPNDGEKPALLLMLRRN